MAGRVSVLNSRELRATVTALKALPRELRKEIRIRTRNVAGPEWSKAMASAADTDQESRVLVKTARINVSDQNIRVRSASSRRKVLSGGLVPITGNKPIEFGNRHKQFKPRNRRGYVFYPAAAEMIPRILALWVQTTFRTIAESLEGK
jgi:hypothetical protein